MSKSVLIIDTPRSCEDCPCCVHIIGKKYCSARGIHLGKEGKDGCCPLVSLPEKIPLENARGAYDATRIEA